MSKKIGFKSEKKVPEFTQLDFSVKEQRVTVLSCLVVPEWATRENPYFNLYIVLEHGNNQMRLQNFPDILGEWPEITECSLTKQIANGHVYTPDLNQQS